MLLVHQTGSVRVGEIVRYTITYTPSADRVIPSPSHLHLRIKNTSAIPLRGAYLLGPYALHVATYPATFDPNSKLDNPKRDGTPQFEPNLKAGSTFSARLSVPEDLRVGRNGQQPSVETGENNRRRSNSGFGGASVTWIVEVTSQILFSLSASVKFEILVGRDDKSLDYSLSVAPTRTTTSGTAVDGQTRDNTSPKKRRRDSHHHQKGVYSRAINLVIDDTDSLWNKPPLPVWDDMPRKSIDGKRGVDEKYRRPRNKGKKKIHLVILTHGLHSNLGADMLYLKESIDATAKVARESGKIRRKEFRKGNKNVSTEAGQSMEATLEHVSTAPLSGGQESLPAGFEDDSEDSEDEEIVVRGFPGNATKTENGIQYLGKRLARYILDLTYPDQPVQFVKKRSLSQKITSSFTHSSKNATNQGVPPDEGVPTHEHSTIRAGQGDAATAHSADDLAYTFTSISFVGHSLGGIIQLYAIAYIQKHAPHFFDQIKPVNFVGLASPFLGLSNENPYYVRFALDLGLVGSTGRDLGLNWRAPRVAKSGWSAVMSGLSGSSGDKDGSKDRDIAGEMVADPGAKPLLRVLPTGPAHIVLRKFRNRTVYSNVVNDGIVPLRTSCLLFLDWRGLGKVEKARRENGIVGTMIGWGWAEMTGQNTVAVPEDEDEDEDEELEDLHETDVPQPSEDALHEDDEAIKSIKSSDPDKPRAKSTPTKVSHRHRDESPGAIDSILSFLRLSAKTTKKDLKMFKRSQTLSSDDFDQNGESSTNGSPKRSAASNGDPLDSRVDSPSRGEVRAVMDNEDDARGAAPPKTTIFESAADLLSPPTPPMSWIIDPSTRARTIFHDRVYHPEDIPPPPTKLRNSRSASTTSFKTGASGSGSSTAKHPSQESSSTLQEHSPDKNSTSGSGMRVEEKIARAYHRDLSWRKVLVRLEPDAHNNMVVRRTFANAYGWPVVKHLCDTHFADTWTARTRDEHEPATDRARAIHTAAGTKDKVVGQESAEAPDDIKRDEMMRHGTGELDPLEKGGVEEVRRRLMRGRSGTKDSVDGGDESYLDDTSDDETERDHEENALSPTSKRESTGLGGMSVPGPLRDFFNSNPGSPKGSLTSTPGSKPKVASKLTEEPEVMVDGTAPMPVPLPIPIAHKSTPAAPLLSPTEVGLRKQPGEVLAGRQNSGQDDGTISELVARYASHSSASGSGAT